MVFLGCVCFVCCKIPRRTAVSWSNRLVFAIFPPIERPSTYRESRRWITAIGHRPPCDVQEGRSTLDGARGSARTFNCVASMNRRMFYAQRFHLLHGEHHFLCGTARYPVVIVPLQHVSKRTQS
ncbi:hypothetical protein DAEQUDRAFT_116212 [Daedalea quercina L-15889]|uniref:Uncharacterized protein n=1 Tax=Daedalea quercina L-15889 TaxID=1314783 RepID=A0A165KTF2_9APHY|nr:hypothetical protein DAEQUDRAFT_116212 [Daedalea quercina L-15889]